MIEGYIETSGLLSGLVVLQTVDLSFACFARSCGALFTGKCDNWVLGVWETVLWSIQHNMAVTMRPV